MINIKKIQFLLLLFVMVFTNKLVFAQQDENYYVEHYTKENGLPFNTVSLITEDSNGFFWIFTYGGVARWNGKNFKKIVDPETGVFSQLKYVWGKSCYQNKVILNRHGRYFYIDSLSKIQPFYNEKNIYFPPKSNGIDWNHLDAICNKLSTTQKNKISREIAFIKNNLSTLLSFVINDTLSVIISDSSYCLFVTPNLIYSATQQGTNHFDLLIGKQLFRLYDNSGVVLISPDTAIKLGYEIPVKDWKNSIKHYGYNANSGYYFRYNEFILKLSFVNGKLKCDTLLKNIKDDFLCMHVSEKNGIILIGARSGLYKYQQNYFRTQKEITQSRSNDIYSHVITPNFVVTNQNITERLPKLNYTKWFWGDVGAMVKLKNGNILANIFYELILFDSTLKPIHKWPIKEKSIHSIVEIGDKIFYGGQNIGWINKQTGKVSIIPISQNSSSLALNRLVKGDLPNTLLLLLNGCVYRLNTINGILVKLFQHKFTYPNFLHYDHIKQFYVVGDKLNGITLINKDGVRINLPLDRNSNLLNAHYILQDKDNDYWIPTNGGLYLIRSNNIDRFIKTRNINDFNYDYVGKQLGIEEDEFNGGFSNCGLFFGDSLSLGSMSGIIKFNVSLKSKLFKSTNKVLIENIFVDDELAKLDSSNILVIKPNYKNLKIEIDCARIGNTGSDLYYRILGTNDSSWRLIELDYLTINRLTAGNYTLEISTEKVKNNGTKSLNIQVEPFWYKTKWFLFTILCAVVLLVYFIIYFKVEQVKGREAMKLDKQRMKLFSVIAHDLRTPVSTYNYIVETIEYLIKEGRYDDIKLIGQNLDKSSRSLQLLLNNLLHWSLKQQGLTKLKSEIMPVKSSIQDLINIYQPIADFKNIKIQHEQTDEILLYKSKLSFDMLMRNILDNCIKYSLKDSTIRVLVYRTTNEVMIEIKSISKVSVLSKEVNEFKAQIENNKDKSINSENQTLGHIIINESLRQINANAMLEIDDLTNEIILKVNIPLNVIKN